MARINIEDSLLKDDKFTELCIKLGSRIHALGVVTESFILAQKYYMNEVNDRLIPLNEWHRKKELHVLLDVEMAEQFENGVYIKGSKESFSWLLQKQAAGKKSAVLKRIKREMASTGVERASMEFNVQQPPTLTLTPTLSSFSNSNSNSNSISNLVGTEPKNSVPARQKKKHEMVEVRFSQETTISLKQNLLKSWSDTYPKEYLEIEFKKARSWIYANDHKTPRSERGWSTFLNSWLNRGWEQYRKSLTSNPPKVSLEEFEEMMRSGI